MKEYWPPKWVFHWQEPDGKTGHGSPLSYEEAQSATKFYKDHQPQCKTWIEIYPASIPVQSNSDKEGEPKSVE